MSYQPTMVQLAEDSKAFQLLIDPIAETFDVPVWDRYMSYKFTPNLDWRSILGVVEAVPTASVIDFSSGKPLAVRPSMSKLNGELATLGNKYQMSKREQRDFMNLQDNVGNLGIDPTVLIDFLVPDLRRAVLGPHKTLGMWTLEAISTGQMTLTNVNNPKGVIWNAALDWGVEKETVVTVWNGNPTTAVPLTDIRTVVEEWSDKGVNFNLMKMSRTTFNLMTATTQFKEAYGLEIKKGDTVVQVSNNQFLRLEKVNVFLESVDLPMIEIVNDPFTVEAKDGTTSVIRPFADNRVSFSVDNDYGELYWTYANESRSPNKVKTYATSNNVLISKYMDVDGNEFTEGEFTAFPVLNKVKQIAIMQTDVATS
jgi:hypothetical protein